MAEQLGGTINFSTSSLSGPSPPLLALLFSTSVTNDPSSLHSSFHIRFAEHIRSREILEIHTLPQSMDADYFFVTGGAIKKYFPLEIGELIRSDNRRRAIIDHCYTCYSLSGE